MRFRIAEDPDFRFTLSNAVLLQYCLDIKPFSQPNMITSDYLDILYHEKGTKNVTLRVLTFYVKQEITLLTSISKSKTVFQNMDSGEMEVLLDDDDNVIINQSNYGLFHFNTALLPIKLQPGKHELIRLEFSEEGLRKFGPKVSIIQPWLENFSIDEYDFYGKELMFEQLKELIHELLNTSTDTPLREAWFSTKLQQALILIIENEIMVNQ